MAPAAAMAVNAALAAFLLILFLQWTAARIVPTAADVLTAQKVVWVSRPGASVDSLHVHNATAPAVSSAD
jgi:hypothetical protein